MAHFRLYELDDKEFEKLVADICIDVLGPGFVNFAEGRDGGRDGTFRGTAAKVVSATDLLNGHTIAQAKHTTNPVASCSDNAFYEKILDHEIERLNKISLDHYFILTNRKLTGGFEQKIHDKIVRATKVQRTLCWGVERISLHLENNKPLVQKYKLSKEAAPLHFAHQDISEIVKEFNKTWDRKLDSDAKYDFSYVEIEKKNQINGLTEDYFNYIKQDSEKYFWQITDFLQNPINSEYENLYSGLADELKGKLITNRDNFSNFDEALEYVHNYCIENNPYLSKNKKLLKVFIHYMYCNCDIGKK